MCTVQKIRHVTDGRVKTAGLGKRAEEENNTKNTFYRMLFHAFVCIPMVDLHASCACDFRSTSHFLFNLLSVFTKTTFNRTEKVLNTSNLLNPFPTYFHVHIMKKIQLNSW